MCTPHTQPPADPQYVSPRPLLLFVAWATCAPYMYVKEGSAVCPAVGVCAQHRLGIVLPGA